MPDRVDGHRHRLVERLRPKPSVEAQPRQPLRMQKIGQRLDRRQALGLDALEQHVDALVGEGQLHFAGPLGRQEAAEQRPQRRDQSEQLGPQDMALAHVDDLVRLRGVEADHRALARASAPASWRGGGCCGGDRCGSRISVARPCCASAPSIRDTR